MNETELNDNTNGKNIKLVTSYQTLTLTNHTDGQFAVKDFCKAMTIN
jgi:hypothetical protein